MNCVCGYGDPVDDLRIVIGTAKRRRRVPCSACGLPILRGEDVREHVYLHEGEFGRDVAHVECFDIMRRGSEFVCGGTGYTVGTGLEDLMQAAIAADDSMTLGWLPSEEVREFVIDAGERLEALEAREGV